MVSIADQTAFMLANHDDNDFTQNMYAQEIYGFESMQGYLDAPDYTHPRTSQDSYPGYSSFTAAPVYPESQQYVTGRASPTLYPDESSEFRPPPSNLSTASGPSASSSTMGSPYSNHGQPVPGPEWPGLGINPSIVGGGFDNFQDFNYTTSGMEHEIAFTDVTKSHVFVGECPKVSESSSSVSSFIPSKPMSMIGSHLDHNGSDASTLRSTQSPRSAITPPSSGGDFFFKSPSTPASSTSPLSTRRFSVISQSNSSTAGRTQDCRSSPFLSATQSFQPDVIEPSSYTTTYHQSPFFSQTSGQFIPPLESSCLFPLSLPYTYHSFLLRRKKLLKYLLTRGIPDPSLIHQYTGAPAQTPVTGAEQIEYQPHHMYPPPQSPTPSNHSAQSSRPIKRSQSPFLNAYRPYPYPQRRPSLMSHASYGSQDGSFDSDDNREKGRCPNLDCGKVFKDLKAHMLTHQNERPEKCPIATCDYHIKGFARKYDKNRHTLTHYKGTMVCGFCPGSGSSAEKSFNRADVFKRHLTSVHAVEQTPPNSRKKTSGGVNAGKKLAGYAPDATGKCSTCSSMFQNAQDFYEHLDDCVLRIVQQEDPSEAINARRLAEVENDPAVHETLRNNGLPTTTINHYSADEDEDDEELDDADDDDYTLRGSKYRRSTTLKASTRVSPNGSVQKSRSGDGLTHSKGGVALRTKGRKKRKDYPASWGCPTPQMKMKKRVMCAFDGPRRLWKDDMMLSTEYEVRIPLSDGKSYVTDLDVQTIKRAEAFLDATDEEKGPYEQEMDLEKLMAVKNESL
jgi:hypothetical protein